MEIKKLAENIIEKIGKKENIENLTHCATRLRFTLKNINLADVEGIKVLEGVIGVSVNGGQFQIIIGNKVSKVYKEIKNLLEKTNEKSNIKNSENKKGIEKIFDFISGIFSPALPAIIGAGLLKSFLALIILIKPEMNNNLYYFLKILGDAPLYFLPIILSFTGAKKLGCNPIIAVSISGALLHPNYTILVKDIFNIEFIKVMGIPLTLTGYGASVLPAILIVITLFYFEKIADKIIPSLFQFFLKPVLSIVIVGGITFFILGPIGILIGMKVSAGLNYIDNYVGWLVPVIIGGFSPLIITTGMHYGLVPFMLQSISLRGYERISGPGQLCSNIAQGAAGLAISLKTQKSDLKKTGLISGTTALFGITEPMMFGITLKYRKILFCVMTGGAIGGFYSGIMGVKAFSFCSPGLLSLAAFVGDRGWYNLIHSIISMLISFVITFILVWVWGSVERTEKM